ncbi:MAG: alpha/beta hydrolase [Hyphomicrobium sp.]|nr:alpha/beta hydrolase [Hyphomicrobium sp.]
MLKTFLIIGVLAYAGIMAAIYVMQRQMIYARDPVHTAPADAGLANVVERTILTADGERLIAWYGKAQPGQPTLLYFHGNGGALEIRRERMAKYLERGRGMLMMAYRGYSGSSGLPTETANVADGKRAYQMLIDDGISPNDIIVYGESLGTGIAVQLAAEKLVRGVILDSPYTSLLERAQLSYPWLPVRLLLKDRYMSRDHIDKVTAPVFILHGEADEVIPVAMGRALFEIANEPKQLVTLPGAGHNDHYLFGSFEAINAWIDKLWAGAITTRQ